MPNNKSNFIAFLYKSLKNNIYVANCYSASIAGYGKTETLAVENLKKSLSDLTKSDCIEVTIMPELKICNG